MRRDFVFVTGSADKRREAARILGFEPESHALDLPERQSLDLAAILKAKAEAAFAALRRPVLVEDVSFEIAAMNGFPGPLVKWMLAALGAEGLAQAALALGDGEAKAVCALAFYDGESLRTFAGETTGHLVAQARGRNGFGWDPVFQPQGSELTFAELEPSEKDRFSHRGKAWRAFAAAFRSGTRQGTGFPPSRE